MDLLNRLPKPAHHYSETIVDVPMNNPPVGDNPPEGRLRPPPRSDAGDGEIINSGQEQPAQNQGGNSPSLEGNNLSPMIPLPPPPPPLPPSGLPLITDAFGDAKIIFPSCGNGIIEIGEMCDDGYQNFNNEYGCNRFCTWQ